MKIAFIWYFDKASQIYPYWKDGLRSAIEIIEKKHKVDWFFDKELPKDPYKYDFILIWDDPNTVVPELLFNYKDKFPVRMGLCLTAMPQDFSKLRNFDVVYCESEPVYQAVKQNGIRAIKAFGTDTDFFAPTANEKDLEYFYPATFSPWKRQGDIAYLGDKLTCIGTVQPDGLSDLAKCKENSVNVEIGYFHAEKIKNCYNRAKNVIIPAVHGSERTVLEAMSTDILPEILYPEENYKAYSYIKEYKESGLDSPREFVIKNYSHTKYAQDLLKGIEE